MLEINPAALLIQIANFLILLFLLNKLLFKPIRSVLAERAGKIQTLAEAAGSFEARASSSEREIRDGREASRRAGLAEKDRLKGEAQEEERRVMEEALKASSR